MFFWMIVFYCFFIYCAKLHGHLDYTGSNELNSNKELFDSMEDSSFNDDYNYLNDPVYKDVPGNVYNTSNE